MMKLKSFLFAALAAFQSIGQANGEELPPFYNPGETPGSFEMIMKPYPIPVETTTYVDFFFNIPDDAPDLFHIVMGEVINSQPTHLHHFVLTGCTEKVDEAIEGMPFDFDAYEMPPCTIPVGGWAPGGNVFSNIDLDTGIIMGRKLGIQALQLNVHYTDGIYEDDATETQRMATDGIRVHYTSDFRPYTSVNKPLINIGAAIDELYVPAGESRFFVTKTCKVNTSCKDIDPETLQFFASFGLGLGDQAEGITCESITPFCNLGGPFGPYVQQLCPESCGFCEDVEGGVNPLNPGSYRVSGINFHAHLLGREMYATHLREATPDPSVAIQKSSLASEWQAKDMSSKEFWIYDFQETYPFGFEDITSSDGTTILRGTEIMPGDKIQVTCVYDATSRVKDTIFGISTYDEMCITTIVVTFETPGSLLNPSGNATNLDLRAELNLMSFTCDADEETDVYTGTLAYYEDGRDIWKTHPISSAEGCTFPADEFSLALYQSRNCPVLLGEDFDLCTAIGGDMMNDNIAGYSCLGGEFSERDSNDGTTQAQCVGAGGQWNAYTCEEIDYWIQFQAASTGIDNDSLQYVIDNWWAPNCCGDGGEGSSASGLATGAATLALMSATAAMML